MDFKTDPAFWLKFQKAMKVWEDNFPWNPRILKMTFLYPFQNKIVQIFGNLTLLLCLLILLVTTILKLIKDIKNEIKYSTMVEIIFQLVAFAMIIFCYMFMISSKNKIYEGIVLMTRLWLACDEVQEMKIKYGRIGYILTNLQAGSILLSLIGFVSAPVAIPSFLTWVLPGNQTQEKTLPLHTEFFLDEDEYFYHIFAAQFVLIFVYSLIIASMIHFQLSAISFIMCEIWFYRYRLEGMSNAYNWKRAINEKNANKWICEQLKDIVRCHEICIEYYWILQKNCDPLMFVILSCCSCMVVLTGTSMVMLVETDLTGATKMLIVFGLTLFAIIFICIPSQLLKNASEDFYITSCIMNGQIHSPKIRKMLLLIMMRTMKPFVLTAGSTIELNLETCSTIIKSSLSYIAALRSVYKSL